MSEKKLFAVGDFNVDILLNSMESLPRVGTEILAGEMGLAMGGSSAIFAANAALLGIPTTFCSAVGSDFYASFLIQELEEKGIDTNHINTIEGAKTGATIILNYDQDRANVTYSGAMDFFNVDHIPWEMLKSYQHFHLANFFLLKKFRYQVVEVFRKAKSLGLTTSLDMQWDPLEKWDFDYQACLPFVDVFFPNESELLALTRENSIQEALEKLKPYANIVALKLGDKGSVGLLQDQQIQVPAFRAKEFADSIGAGDSFNVGFIKKYIAGGNVEECLKNGNLMGAINTTKAGGTAAFEDAGELEKKIKTLLQTVKS